MDKNMLVLTFGALLHDVGKIIHRSSKTDGRAHNISGRDFLKEFEEFSDEKVLNCVYFHHKKDLQRAEIPENDPSYIVYAADNISAGADRRETEGETEEGFDKSAPLQSVFNLLNGRSGTDTFPIRQISEHVFLPNSDGTRNTPTEYSRISDGFKSGLSGIYCTEEYINSLLELCEAYFSYIPSSTYKGEVSDISLFDHLKTTAALASCIKLYLGDERNDYKKELFLNEQSFFNEKAFILFSVDMSGIQKFIYNISSGGALKALRSRSFYLEILLENITDEILADIGLSRANLIYTGGGHAYFLLPNRKELTDRAINRIKEVNIALLEQFADRLFVAYGYTACSANELMSRADDPEAFSNIFRGASAGISKMKLQRYTYEDLELLNSDNSDSEGRECSACGKSSALTKREDIYICDNCAAFIDISDDIIKPESVFVVSLDKINKPFVKLPLSKQKTYLYAMSKEDALDILKEKPETVKRLYSKNAFRTGLSLSTKLWMGDYYAKDAKGRIQTFETLSKNSEGIDRIGILQADIDNLGAAFVSGFLRSGTGKDKYRYLTISRTSALSRSLSMFFKFFINDIMQNAKYNLYNKSGLRNVVIVYSGGDDLFIVGAWDEVLSAAIDIKNTFAAFTGGALTLSAGFGVYNQKYPLSLGAEQTKELENAAKNNVTEKGAKNSIALFGGEFDTESSRLVYNHTYDWQTFETIVLGEMFGCIKTLYSSTDEFGNTYLYNLMQYIKNAEDDKINIARIAYFLSKNRPKKQEAQKAYPEFVKNIYKWAIDPKTRKQLLTAIQIYIYSIRERKEEDIL